MERSTLQYVRYYCLGETTLCPSFIWRRTVGANFNLRWISVTVVVDWLCKRYVRDDIHSTIHQDCTYLLSKMLLGVADDVDSDGGTENAVEGAGVGVLWLHAAMICRSDG